MVGKLTSARQKKTGVTGGLSGPTTQTTKLRGINSIIMKMIQVTNCSVHQEDIYFQICGTINNSITPKYRGGRASGLWMYVCTGHTSTPFEWENCKAKLGGWEPKWIVGSGEDMASEQTAHQSPQRVAGCVDPGARRWVEGW